MNKLLRKQIHYSKATLSRVAKKAKNFIINEPTLLRIIKEEEVVVEEEEEEDADEDDEEDEKEEEEDSEEDDSDVEEDYEDQIYDVNNNDIHQCNNKNNDSSTPNYWILGEIENLNNKRRRKANFPIDHNQHVTDEP
jgi:hypothetical protein